MAQEMVRLRTGDKLNELMQLVVFISPDYEAMARSETLIGFNTGS